MAVLVLLGNTSIKVSRTRGEMLSIGLAEAEKQLMDLLTAGRGEAIVVASVNPSAEKLLADACRETGGAKPLFAGKDFPVGVEMAVDNPGGVGVDRILNVKAAWTRSRAASVAVDFGTAVSVSAADSKGRFVGGAILPGLGLALETLARGTAFLPETQPAAPESVLGRDTVPAMRSGVYYGAIGAVKEVVSRTAEVLGEDLQVFITGGDAALLAEDVPRDWAVVEGLTLEGLRLAYEESLQNE